MSYEYDAYLVRLDPQDDNGYAHIARLPSWMGPTTVKILSPAEGDKLRELLLADGELGKKVGVNGIHGEGYIVRSTFPKIAELHNFFRAVACEEMDYDKFYIMNAEKKEASRAAAVSKAEGGKRRRRSFRKSRQGLRRKSLITRH